MERGILFFFFAEVTDFFVEENQALSNSKLPGLVLKVFSKVTLQNKKLHFEKGNPRTEEFGEISLGSDFKVRAHHCIFRYSKDSLPSQFKVHLGQGTEKDSSAKKKGEVQQLLDMNRRLTPASKKRTRERGVKSSEGGANSVSLSSSKDLKDKIKLLFDNNEMKYKLSYLQEVKGKKRRKRQVLDAPHVMYQLKDKVSFPLGHPQEKTLYRSETKEIYFYLEGQLRS